MSRCDALRSTLVAWALFAACSRSSVPEPPRASTTDAARPQKEHEDESEHEALPSKVRLAKKVVTEAGIKVAPAETAALPETVTLTGEVVADPDRSAKVAVRVPGRIVDVRFKEGDRVKAGAVLLVIESGELARARATLTATGAKARSVRQNAERLAAVAKRGLASGQEVAQAEADAVSAEAEVRAARQTLSAFGPGAMDTESEAARLQLRAPITGSVLSRDAVRGETVTADKVVAVLADLDKAYFVARLFEQDLARVKVGSAVEVRLNAYPNEVFTGTVETIGKQLDATARTVTARVALPNRNDLLKVGLFGNALVVTDTATRTPRVVVPLPAVTEIAGKHVVFVRQPDEDFDVHPVTLGRSAGGRVEVTSGLRAGEQVAVDGVFSLKSAVMKSTFGEEE